MLVLLLAFIIPYRFPQWDTYVVRFLWTNWLFTGAVLLTLLFLFLWKLPQWQVAKVLNVQDRVDLESKARQTLAQMVGGAVLFGGL